MIYDGSDAVALIYEHVPHCRVLVVFPGRDDISQFLESFTVLGVIVDILLHLPSSTSCLWLHICTSSKRALSRELVTEDTHALFHPLYVFLEALKFGSKPIGLAGEYFQAGQLASLLRHPP